MSDEDFVPYAPLNALKPIARDVWIVDGPEVRFWEVCQFCADHEQTENWHGRTSRPSGPKPSAPTQWVCVFAMPIWIINRMPLVLKPVEQ